MTTGVLTTSFPRFPGDFAGCFVEDDVRARVAQGETVEVIAAGDTGFLPPETERTASVWRIPTPPSHRHAKLFYGAGAPEALERGGPIAWVQALGFWAGLCERARDRAPSWDRVVAHWLVPCGVAARAVAPHLPLTAHAHSGDVALLERIPFGAELGRWLARDPCDLIFASTNLRERFARLTGFTGGRVAPAASVVIRPESSARSEVRETARRELGLHRHTVLAVGRLIPIKGFDVLVRAAALAGAQDRTGGLQLATVVVLGDGPERSRLAALAHRLNVDLRLPGFVPRGDVNRWMAGADLYVQPSRPLSSGRTEGLPVAAIEAVRAGLPVVVSATGGLCELPGLASDARLTQQPVRLVTAEDPRALARCLLEHSLSLRGSRLARKGGGGTDPSAAKLPTRNFLLAPVTREIL